MPNEDLRKFYPEGYRPLPPSVVPMPVPVPTPEPELEPELEESDDGREQLQEQTQKPKRGWNWIGSPSRPEAKKHKDGISDLFEVGFDNDLEDVNDLVTVDIKRDVVDVGHDGTLDDLVDVFPEDIMGVNSIGQKPSRKQLRKLRAERKARRSASEFSTSVRRVTE